jgi:hypothetical protein
MRIQRYMAGVWFFLSIGTVQAQSVQVNQQNRTIEIAANSSIEIEADLVTIIVGYHNYGRPMTSPTPRMRELRARFLRLGPKPGFPRRVFQRMP